MPLPVPNLDDRTFDQLVLEGRSLIPRYSQEWTNHNPSDPGITLLELFAWLTETALFQLDQVPDISIERFLRLLNVCRQYTNAQPEAIDTTLQRALDALDSVTRTVTVDDFETLAKTLAAEATKELAAEAAKTTGTAIIPVPIARAAFVTYTDPLCQPATPAALVIVVPNQPQDPKPSPSQDLADLIFQQLRQHCLLGTRLHVVGPQYINIEVTTTVVRKSAGGLTRADLEQSIRTFLDPLRGGFDGTGWPFGRSVYYSELYQWLETLPNVDHVESLAISSQSDQAEVLAEGVKIPAQALVSAAAVTVTVTG